MKKDKPEMGGIVAAILSKGKGKEKEEDKSEDYGSQEEDSPRQAIAQDLINALRSDDVEGVLSALDAFSETSSEDCGCK